MPKKRKGRQPANAHGACARLRRAAESIHDKALRAEFTRLEQLVRRKLDTGDTTNHYETGTIGITPQDHN